MSVFEVKKYNAYEITKKCKLYLFLKEFNFFTSIFTYAAFGEEHLYASNLLTFETKSFIYMNLKPISDFSLTDRFVAGITHKKHSMKLEEFQFTLK